MSTLTAHKKKGKATDSNDLFEDAPSEDDDLFASAAASSAKPTSAPARPVAPKPIISTTKKLDPKRIEAFEKERTETLHRCAADREKSRPLPKKHAVRNALKYVDTTEQLDATVEILLAMRKAKIDVAEETGRDLIGTPQSPMCLSACQKLNGLVEKADASTSEDPTSLSRSFPSVRYTVSTWTSNPLEISSTRSSSVLQSPRLPTLYSTPRPNHSRQRITTTPSSSPAYTRISSSSRPARTRSPRPS